MPEAYFRVTRKGQPIETLRIKEAVNPQIEYSEYFAEWEACVGAGLDMWTWVNGGYPDWFMAECMVWYQYHNLIRTHSEAAAIEKSKRKAK